MTALVREPVTALASVEREDLVRHEGVIATGLKTFVAVGNALVDIRDRRLYREDYDTFEEYCRDRWNLKRQRAYELMDSAEVTRDLSEISDKLPERESHTAPLSPLAPTERQDAWAYAQHIAGDGRMTARVVELARDELADLRSAVSTAGGIWYSSRDGKHMVGLPDQPDRRYSTEELREALGITTVEVAPAPAELPQPTPPAMVCQTCGTAAKVLYGNDCQGCYTTRQVTLKINAAQHAGPASDERRAALDDAKALLPMMPVGEFKDLAVDRWRQLNNEYLNARASLHHIVIEENGRAVVELRPRFAAFSRALSLDAHGYFIVNGTPGEFPNGVLRTNDVNALVTYLRSLEQREGGPYDDQDADELRTEAREELRAWLRISSPLALLIVALGICERDKRESIVTMELDELEDLIIGRVLAGCYSGGPALLWQLMRGV